MQSRPEGRGTSSPAPCHRQRERRRGELLPRCGARGLPAQLGPLDDADRERKERSNADEDWADDWPALGEDQLADLAEDWGLEEARLGDYLVQEVLAWDGPTA